MRTKAIVAVLAATIASAACASPSVAETRERGSDPLPVVTASIQLRGSHGYQIFFGSADRSHGSDFLSVSRHPRSSTSESVAYLALTRRPEFDGNVLDVSLGRRGHFHARFVPRSTRHLPQPPNCPGPPMELEEGIFVGSFAFRGERGYTTARAKRAKGIVTRREVEHCRLSADDAKSAREGTKHDFRLLAGGRSGPLLDATHRGSITTRGGLTTVDVSLTEKRSPRLSVIRSATVFDVDGRSAYLTVPNLAEPLTEATLKPPAPFSGSATFRLEDPRTASWTGDLTVELPGLGPVPLTGSAIYAATCLGVMHCTETLPAAVRERAGSELVFISGTGS